MPRPAPSEQQPAELSFIEMEPGMRPVGANAATRGAIPALGFLAALQKRAQSNPPPATQRSERPGAEPSPLPQQPSPQLLQEPQLNEVGEGATGTASNQPLEQAEPRLEAAATGRRSGALQVHVADAAVLMLQEPATPQQSQPSPRPISAVESGMSSGSGSSPAAQTQQSGDLLRRAMLIERSRSLMSRSTPTSGAGAGVSSVITTQRNPVADEYL